MTEFKSWQFDPAVEPYPEEWGAWCHGPGAFYAATPRGSIPLGKSDWIVEYPNGDRVVVNNQTYNDYFKEQAPPQSTTDQLIEESERLLSQGSGEEPKPEPPPEEPKPDDAAAKGGRSSRSR